MRGVLQEIERVTALLDFHSKELLEDALRVGGEENAGIQFIIVHI